MYLAKHCGWDKDFIAEHFTLGQLKIYFEHLVNMEIADTKRMAMAFRAAQTKDEDFAKFMESDDTKNVDNPETIDEMKRLNIIEEQ